MRFHYPNGLEPQKYINPTYLREIGFRRQSAIRHPKGLGLMELWKGQAFRADSSKLGENVKNESV